MDRRLKERLVGAAILVFFAVLFIPELLSGPARPRGSPQEAPAEQIPTGTASSLRTYTVDLEHPAAGAVLTPQASSAADGRAASGETVPSTSAGNESSFTPATREVTPAESPPAHEVRSAAATPDATRSSPAAAHEETPSGSDARDTTRAGSTAARDTTRGARDSARPGAPAGRTALHTATPAPNTFAPIDARGGWSLQVGSFANRANAEKLAQNLRAKGIRVYVSSSGAHHRVRAGPFPDRPSAERAAGKLRAQGHATSIVPP